MFCGVSFVETFECFHSNVFSIATAHRYHLSWNLTSIISINIVKPIEFNKSGRLPPNSSGECQCDLDYTYISQYMSNSPPGTGDKRISLEWKNSHKMLFLSNSEPLTSIHDTSIYGIEEFHCMPNIMHIEASICIISQLQIWKMITLESRHNLQIYKWSQVTGFRITCPIESNMFLLYWTVSKDNNNDWDDDSYRKSFTSIGYPSQTYKLNTIERFNSSAMTLLYTYIRARLPWRQRGDLRKSLSHKLLVFLRYFSASEVFVLFRHHPLFDIFQNLCRHLIS